MTNEDISLANRAIRLASQGNISQVDALEEERGESLSSILDYLWDAAEDSGKTRLARRIESAFNRLTR